MFTNLAIPNWGTTLYWGNQHPALSSIILLWLRLLFGLLTHQIGDDFSHSEITSIPGRNFWSHLAGLNMTRLSHLAFRWGFRREILWKSLIFSWDSMGVSEIPWDFMGFQRQQPAIIRNYLDVMGMSWGRNHPLYPLGGSSGDTPMLIGTPKIQWLRYIVNDDSSTIPGLELFYSKILFLML